LIDFHGMRKGCLFYDLDSLIYDHYVTFTDEERNELLDFYYELINSAHSHGEFIQNFWMGSVQRLLQALGAYGFLGLKKHNPAFLKHIANGIENLLIAIDNVGGLELLAIWRLNAKQFSPIKITEYHSIFYECVQD
jgi:aminoglycoside/choline kinase family phosphotransferase